MSNSLANDYFSFMSDRWEAKGQPPTVPTKQSLKAAKMQVSGDVIEFVEEPQIEVVESEASDTIIERLFRVHVNDH
jgi:hypothetical protein